MLKRIATTTQIHAGYSNLPAFQPTLKRNADIEEKLNKLENELPIDDLELASND